MLLLKGKDIQSLEGTRTDCLDATHLLRHTYEQYFLGVGPINEQLSPSCCILSLVKNNTINERS